jgi:hypothetical protein
VLRTRFETSIARVKQLAPEVEVRVLSPAEIGFRLCGLEFARAQVVQAPGFRNVEEIVFGVGPYRATLSDDNAAEFAGFVHEVRKARRPSAPRSNLLWRMQPERWLESLVVRNVSALDSRLDPSSLYSQVPAFSASDRAMIDVLTLTRERRLAVVELKADEDIQLPLQGLDYWARVEWHRERGEFQKFGYFPGIEIAEAPPLLLLVAPALHIHPATDTLLRYIAPEIECELVGIGEKWRREYRWCSGNGEQRCLLERARTPLARESKHPYRRYCGRRGASTRAGKTCPRSLSMTQLWAHSTMKPL